MRILVIYCHPVETSYNAALHTEVVQQLRGAGHEVDDCDLYAEGFNPVMTREERLGYHEVPSNQLPVQGYVDRLLWAEAAIRRLSSPPTGSPTLAVRVRERKSPRELRRGLRLLRSRSFLRPRRRL